MITKQELSTAESNAPFLSEGAISPWQVSTMSKREKVRYDKNVQIRFKMERDFKRQSMTQEELNAESEAKEKKKIESRILQITCQMELIKDFPQMKSKRNNSLKRTYQDYETELRKLKGGIIQ